MNRRGISELIVCMLVCTLPPRLPAQEASSADKHRPPVLLEFSREERLMTAVDTYLRTFVQAIQRADTIALQSLIALDQIPEDERSVAQRAGCVSVGHALLGLRAARAGEIDNPEMPLRGVRLSDPNITLGNATDTLAAVSVRIEENRANAIYYAPLAFLFRAEQDRVLIMRSQGVLSGLCGLATAHR